MKMSFRLAVATLTLFGFTAVTGCDSGSVATGDIAMEGRVTTAPSSESDTQQGVDNARVTAARVSANGQIEAMDGEATTAADGSFTLNSRGSTEAVIITATSGNNTYRALVEAGGANRGTVQIAPMTIESDGEAAVFIAARQNGSQATVADVMAFVNAEIAAQIRAGAASASDVAVALDHMLRAEAAYNPQGGSGTTNDMSDSHRVRAEAVANLRTQLAAASTGEQRRAASQTFVQAFATARTGSRADVQAEALRASALASARFTNSLSAGAALELRRQARILAAVAASAAIEAAFSGEGAPSGRVQAIANARAQLVTALRAAASASAMTAAEAAFSSTVETELAAQTGTSSANISQAVSATATARTALNTAVAAAANGQAVAQATTTYFAAARSAAQVLLTTQATFGARVAAHLGLMP